MTHGLGEYVNVLTRVLRQAQDIAEYCKARGFSDPAKLMLYCIQFGYVGFPLSGKQLQAGGWLARFRQDEDFLTPEKAKDAICVAVFFSDDELPGLPNLLRQREDGITVTVSSFYSPNAKILALPEADRKTPVDLALEFLHEARHAAYYYSREQGRPVIDDEGEHHEEDTWRYWLSILDIWGGTAWREAVREEEVYLRDLLSAKGRKPGSRYFAMSNIYRAELLDPLFGPINHEPTKQARNLLVGMRAMISLAVEEEHFLPDTAVQNIVGAYYDFAHQD